MAQPVEKLIAHAQNLQKKFVNIEQQLHEALPLFATTVGRGRKARRTGHNLLIRLRDYKADVLRFLTVPGVPFTNNQAEQDIRMMKCKQKISGLSMKILKS